MLVDEEACLSEVRLDLDMSGWLDGMTVVVDVEALVVARTSPCEEDPGFEMTF